MRAPVERRYGREVSVLRRKIVGFHKDEEGHWVAELECGHGQHVRHAPPLNSRPWVLSQEGRASRVGVELDCKKCEEGGGDAPLKPHTPARAAQHASKVIVPGGLGLV